MVRNVNAISSVDAVTRLEYSNELSVAVLKAVIDENVRVFNFFEIVQVIYTSEFGLRSQGIPGAFRIVID